MRSPLPLFLTILAISGAATPALAQKKTDEQQAKALYQKAETHFRLREFEEAITALKESYRLLPDPVLLYNLGKCYRELKQYEEAASYFENYLKKDPRAKNRAEIEATLEELKAELKKQEEERLQREQAARLAAPPAAPPDTPRKKTLLGRWWFWAGLTGVALGAGAAVGATALAPTKTDLGNSNALDD
jgi:tetratricopeptide (TPR) repeat protein